MEEDTTISEEQINSCKYRLLNYWSISSITANGTVLLLLSPMIVVCYDITPRI